MAGCNAAFKTWTNFRFQAHDWLFVAALACSVIWCGMCKSALEVNELRLRCKVLELVTGHRGTPVLADRNIRENSTAGSSKHLVAEPTQFKSWP